MSSERLWRLLAAERTWIIFLNADKFFYLSYCTQIVTVRRVLVTGVYRRWTIMSEKSNCDKHWSSFKYLMFNAAAYPPKRKYQVRSAAGHSRQKAGRVLHQISRLSQHRYRYYIKVSIFVVKNTGLNDLCSFDKAIVTVTKRRCNSVTFQYVKQLVWLAHKLNVSYFSGSTETCCVWLPALQLTVYAMYVNCYIHSIQQAD